MKYLSNKHGFLGIDNKFNFKEKVVIVPFGLEKTVSYGGGTKNGPKEIIKASHQVELYDEELNCEPYKKIGIKTFGTLLIKAKLRPRRNLITLWVLFTARVSPAETLLTRRSLVSLILPLSISSTDLSVAW